MRSSKKKTIRFIAMWDMTGLEALINVTQIEKEHEDWEKENIFRILKDQDKTLKPAHVPLEMMILRARTNSQRHYEIYAFDSELSEQDIRETFEDSPQVMVDAIRNVGHELYSDRVLKKTQVIV
jgi:hypothetical protein